MSIFIGIDPGSTTGVGIWYSHHKVLKLHQYKSHAEAMLSLREFVETCKSERAVPHFIIEDARLVRGNAFFASKNSSRKDQGVGYVKAYSKDWEAFCKVLGLSYDLKPPTNTKTTPEYFESLTGLKTLKTESHKRDAGMMVLGMKPKVNP
ncbi:hypothetical protein [Rufibacter soli]